MSAQTVLYKLARGDWFVVVAPGMFSDGPPYKLHWLDGMYSLCTDANGNVRHWRVDTPVIAAEQPAAAEPGARTGGTRA